MTPVVLPVPPITEINLPGVYIRVTPPVPWVGAGSAVQVRVARPVRGARLMVRDLIDGALP
jgi:hypothetical protein